MAIQHRLTTGLARIFMWSARRAGRRALAPALALLLGLSLGAAQPAPSTAPAPPARPAAVSGSIWVSATGPQLREAARLDQLVADLPAMPFDEVIVQVRANADAYYNSRLVPRALGVSDAADPLGRLIKQLHAGPRPRRVIAWISPFHAGNANSAAPLSPAHVLNAHPDWLSLRQGGGKTDGDGNLFLEPGLPAVQDHLEAVVRELVSHYDIDGLYIDPVSDPGPDWGYHPEVLKMWREGGKNADPAPGDPAWMTFRADILDVALAGMIGAAREARPKLSIGIGARTDGPAPASLDAFRQSAVFTQAHQDWPRWLNPPVQISRLYLKDFKSESSEAEAFNGWLKLSLTQAAAAGVPVIAGVAGELNESVDAHAQLRRAAEAGVQGVALSDYQQPTRDAGTRQLFMTALARTVLAPAGRPSLGGTTLAASAAVAVAASATTTTTPSAAPTEVAAAPAESVLPIVSSNGKFVRRLKPLEPSPLAKARMQAPATSGTAPRAATEASATTAPAAPQSPGLPALSATPPVAVAAASELIQVVSPTEPTPPVMSHAASLPAGPSRIGDAPALAESNAPVVLAGTPGTDDAATSQPAGGAAPVDPLQAAATLAAHEVNQHKLAGEDKVAAATTTSAPAPGADGFKLPPPPLALEEVPFEGQEPAPVEEGNGRLLPSTAQPGPADSKPAKSSSAAAEHGSGIPARDGDVPLSTLKELAGFKGGKSGDRALSDTLSRATGPVATRREQLGLLTDPKADALRSRTGLRPQDKASDYLRKNFGNIIEP